MSPRRNARATVSRPATRGRTRALGQHFLRDDAIARRIVELVAPTPPDLGVEIGPGRGAFTLPPQVDSAVIHLRVRAAPPVPIADPERFTAVVRAAFAQRRKTLANAIAAGLGLSVDRTRALVASAGIDPGRRAETVSLAEFADLADVLPGPTPR